MQVHAIGRRVPVSQGRFSETNRPLFCRLGAREHGEPLPRAQGHLIFFFELPSLFAKIDLAHDGTVSLKGQLPIFFTAST
jgi:hypothetical protein